MRPQIDHIRRLLLVQPHGIGDLVLATPMLAELRRVAPDLYVAVMAGSEAAATVVRGSPMCDEIFIYNPLQAKLREKVKLISWLRRLAPDACLISPRVSSFKGEILAWLSGAKWRVGPLRFLPWLGYNLSAPNSLQIHKVEGYLLLAGLLFPGLKPVPTFFNLTPEDSAKGDKFWEELGLGQAPVLGIHPGCDPNNPQKRYPLDAYQQLIDQFLEAHPEAHCLLFFGPGEEGLWEQIQPSSLRVAAAKGVPFQVTARLLQRVRVLLTGDSGLGHVASALGTRVVSIFGPANPAITAPWGPGNAIVRKRQLLECQPCIWTPLYGNCDHLSCLRKVEPEEVLSVVESIW